MSVQFNVRHSVSSRRCQQRRRRQPQRQMFTSSSYSISSTLLILLLVSLGCSFRCLKPSTLILPVVAAAAPSQQQQEQQQQEQQPEEIVVEVSATGEVTSDVSESSRTDTTESTKTVIEEQLMILNELVSWVNNLQGGYWNDKQVFKAIEYGDDHDHDDDHDRNESEATGQTQTQSQSSASFGIFAKEFIPKDTLLLQVPFTHILDDEEPSELKQLDDEYGSLKCGTVRNLAREMKAPEESKFRPYVEYLLRQPRGQIPSDYTPGGRRMLLEIVGGLGKGGGGRKLEQRLPPVDPVGWIEEDWYDSCNGQRDDEISTHAAAQVIQRSDDEWMIPVYDIYNHRNGRFFNTRSETENGSYRQILARRDIHEGEEIFNSYNMCDHCGGRKDGYGTPEIFRDYGFVEDFPQRWDFEDEFDIVFDLVEQTLPPDDNGDARRAIKLVWVDRPKESAHDDIEEVKRGLKKELRRLYKVRHLIYSDAAKSGSPTAGIPRHEWDTIWQFHQAVVNAISLAINDLADGNAEEMVPIETGDGSSQEVGVCSIESCGADHYHPLTAEPDDIRYNKPTCFNKEVMRFPGYFLLAHLKTHYQILNFAFREEDGDICMDLEDTLQICSCYRPHYHEYSAQFAARFIEDVKRVIFIGGGDSMLLHESLKFPNLEKVVGLELDQVVTRKSFKYFRTQPHFDDDRVEWWFGDATKSLLLLPEDYWGTFDLVLVDLSETVMAFSVTEHLDVFSALALLLNKEGVMVKNELYMNEMSEVFDYTVSIHVDDNPKICSQAMAFGSNSADFFRQTQKDHMVETLALPPVSQYEDRFDYFHDYRRNNALEQGKCNAPDTSKEPKEKVKSAGILHVLDIEGVTTSLAPKDVESLIMLVAKDMGLSPVSISPVDRPDDGLNMVLVVLKEGYVLARLWPDEKYVGLDVGMWGGFDKASAFQKRLGQEFNPTTLSSFRVVVGGMYGSSTWERDRDIIGPQIVQRRNCDEVTYTDAVFTDVVTQRMVVDEIVNLVATKEIVAVVFCGVKGRDECIAADVLEKNPNTAKIITISTCPSVVDLTPDDPERIGKMISCEQSTIDALDEALNDTIDLLVLDGSAPHEMAQILNSIMATPRHRDEFMSTYHFLMTWSTRPKDVKYQRYLLEQYRKDTLHDPISRAELKIDVDGSGAMEVGLLSVGDLAIFHNMYIFEKKLSKRINSRRDVSATVEVRAVVGGLYRYNHNWQPNEVSHEAYDHLPGDEQYNSQKPMGREVIVQFEFNPDADVVVAAPATDEGGAEGDDNETLKASMPTWKEMTDFLESTLEKIQVTSAASIPRFETYTGVGDGGLCVFAFREGNVVLVWDGRHHVDINVFFRDELKELADSLISTFVTKSNDRLQVTLRDDYPRGTGRVINFQSDIDNFKDIASFKGRKRYVGGNDD